MVISFNKIVSNTNSIKIAIQSSNKECINSYINVLKELKEMSIYSMVSMPKEKKKYQWIKSPHIHNKSREEKQVSKYKYTLFCSIENKKHIALLYRNIIMGIEISIENISYEQH